MLQATDTQCRFVNRCDDDSGEVFAKKVAQDEARGPVAAGVQAEHSTDVLTSRGATPPSSPVRDTDKIGERPNELTPRERRRLILARQARFRDNHMSRGLYVGSAWSEAVDETTA